MNLKKISLLGIISILFVFFAFLRMSKISNEFFGQPGTNMGGLKMHYLPIVFDDWGASCLDNFWKFWVSGEHGVYEYTLNYIGSGILNFLDLPLSPHNLLSCIAVLNIISLLVVVFFVYFVFSQIDAFIVFILLGFSWVHISYSKVPYPFPWFIVFPWVIYLFFYLAYKRNSILYGLIFSAVLGFGLGMDYIFHIQNILLWILFVIMIERKNTSFRFNNFKSVSIIIVSCIAALGAISLQLYLYYGTDSLCILRRLLSTYEPSQFSITRIIISGQNFFLMLNSSLHYKIYSCIFISILILHFILVSKKKIHFFSYINFIVLDFLIFSFMASYIVPRSYYILIHVLIIIGYYLKRIYQYFENRLSYKRVIQVIFILLLFFYMKFSLNQYKSHKVENERPFKAVGYFIRQFGPKYSKVYNFVLGDVIQQFEYYYGKNYQVYHNPKKSNRPTKYFKYNPKLKKLIFSPNEFPIDSVFKYKKQCLIDFYVFFSEYSIQDKDNIVSILVNSGFKKVAEVVDHDLVKAEIYSLHSMEFQKLEMREFNKKWENEIANFPNIYEHHRIGSVQYSGDFEFDIHELKE